MKHRSHGQQVHLTDGTGLHNDATISNRQEETRNSQVLRNSMRRKSLFNPLLNSHFMPEADDLKTEEDQRTLAMESYNSSSMNSNGSNMISTNNNTSIDNNGFGDNGGLRGVEECNRNITWTNFVPGISPTGDVEANAEELPYCPFSRSIISTENIIVVDPTDKMTPAVGGERNGWSSLARPLAEEAVAAALRRSARQRRSNKYLSVKSDVSGSLRSLDVSSECRGRQQKSLSEILANSDGSVSVAEQQKRSTNCHQSYPCLSSVTPLYQSSKQTPEESESFHQFVQNQQEQFDQTENSVLFRRPSFQPDTTPTAALYHPLPSIPSLVPSLTEMLPPVEETTTLPQFPPLNCNYNLPLGVVKPLPVVLSPPQIPPDLLPKPVRKPELNPRRDTNGSLTVTSDPYVKRSKEETSSKPADRKDGKEKGKDDKKDRKKKKKRKKRKKDKKKKEKEEKKRKEEKEKREAKEREKLSREKEKNKMKNTHAKKVVKNESKPELGESDSSDAYETPPSSLRENKSSVRHQGNRSEGKETKSKKRRKQSKEGKDLRKKTVGGKTELQGKISLSDGDLCNVRDNRSEDNRGRSFTRLTRKISHRVGSWSKELRRFLNFKVERSPSPCRCFTEPNSDDGEENSSNSNKRKLQNAKESLYVQKSLSDISDTLEEPDNLDIELTKIGGGGECDDDISNFCDEGKTTQIMNWLHEMYSTNPADSKISSVMAATTVATQF